MTKLFNQLVIFIAVIFLAACNTASTDKKAADTTDTKASFDPAAAKSAIEAENVKFMDAFKKGDSAAIAAMYADDALMLPPNGEAIKKAGIAAEWGAFIRMGIKGFKLITDDVSGNEDQLAETGRYELSGDGNKLIDKGKYVVIWQPSNGSWKLHRDIWNSSMPAALTK